MKTLVLGDIHGRTIWKDIIEKEIPDKIIFLGDYVTTHEGTSSEQQISNLEEILTYKEENSDKVILLRGNHDIQHLGYSWAECSGLDKTVLASMSTDEFKQRFLNLTQWVYIDGTNIFSHAGVSKVWLEKIAKIESVEEINNLEPSEKFGFTPIYFDDFTGSSPTQPLTWIRPQTLLCCGVEGYNQIVGHTPCISKIFNAKFIDVEEKLWLCDALGNRYYLIIDSGTFTVKQYNDNEE